MQAAPATGAEVRRDGYVTSILLDGPNRTHGRADSTQQALLDDNSNHYLYKCLLGYILIARVVGTIYMPDSKCMIQ